MMDYERSKMVAMCDYILIETTRCLYNQNSVVYIALHNLLFIMLQDYTDEVEAINARIIILFHRYITSPSQHAIYVICQMSPFRCVFKRYQTKLTIGEYL